MTGKKGRRAWVNLSYTKYRKASSGGPVKRARDVMKEFMESFTYSDCASGSMDTISIVLNNSDSRFSKGWMPGKRDSMAAFIVTDSWDGIQKQKMRCGTFMVDKIRFSGPPAICEIGGICAPETTSFRTAERSKTWKKATLKGIASTVADKYKLGLVFTGSDVNIGTVEQSWETDYSFLYKTAEEYGYGIKIYRNKILVYDIAEMEDAEPSGTIHKYQVTGGYDWETVMSGTYTGAKIRYTNDDGREVSCIVGKGPRWLHVSGSADNITQAKKLAAARVNNENRGTTTISLEIRGSIKCFATSTVMLKGFNRLSGKYFIDEAEHRVDGSGGYTTHLSMHKVQRRITA